MANIEEYRNKYHITYKINGKKKRVCTKLKLTKENLPKVKKMLKEIEMTIEKKYTDQTNSLLPNRLISKNANLSLFHLTQKCIDERVKYKSPSHLKNFNLATRYLFQVINPEKNVSEITSGEIAAVINLLKENLANASLHTYINYIKLLFNYLVQEDYLAKSPIKKILIPKKDRNNIVIFNSHDLDNILEMAKERDRKYYNALMILLLTGIRPIDLIKIKIENFDLENNILNISISKTSKQIEFPLYDDLYEFLNNNMYEDVKGNKNLLLFEGFSVENLGKRFRRITKTLGIKSEKKYNLKTFRKTFATRMVERGLSQGQVAYLLGHDQITTTAKYYTKTITERLRLTINSLQSSSERIKT